MALISTTPATGLRPYVGRSACVGTLPFGPYAVTHSIAPRYASDVLLCSVLRASDCCTLVCSAEEVSSKSKPSSIVPSSSSMC
jgi:hypothetical protein